MLVEGIQAVMAADTGLQSILGTPTTRSDKSTGLFPTQAPDEVPEPWIVYSQVSGSPLQEAYAGTGRLFTSRWRLSCYGSSYKQAKQLARALKACLVGIQGPISILVSNVPTVAAQVEGSWLRLELDEAEPMLKGTVFVTHIDVMINYIDTDA